MRATALLLAISLAALVPAASAWADVIYNNDVPLNLIGTASTPAGNGFIEHESADDFILPQPTKSWRLTSATFTGLIPAGATIQEVVVEIYRVFPLDSQNPPSGNVPTRANSPSDVAFADRDSAAGELSFTTSTLASSFTALNSVVNGINPLPNVTTGGEGPQTGQEVRFNVTFTPPIVLPPDHYFFVPQVLLAGTTTPFLWLSGPRPAATPFNPDLQSWIRDANLDPDWLRVGTDIVGGGPTAPTFNAAFSITAEAVPEPSGLLLLGVGASVGVVGRLRHRRRRSGAAARSARPA